MSTESPVHQRSGYTGPGSILYRGRGILVTTEWVITRSGRYRVSDLSQLAELRDSVHVGVTISLCIAISTALLVIVTTSMLGASISLVVGAIAVLVPSVAAMICAVRWPPSRFLSADYRGFAVALFSGRDAVEFGRVARAIRRATEIDRVAQLRG